MMSWFGPSTIGVLVRRPSSGLMYTCNLTSPCTCTRTVPCMSPTAVCSCICWARLLDARILEPSFGRRHAQARGQYGGGGERARDPGDARRPSEAIEQLTEHRAADHAAEEIAREIKPACNAAFAFRRM